MEEDLPARTPVLTLVLALAETRIVRSPSSYLW
jgi:hypothetical protein